MSQVQDQIIRRIDKWSGWLTFGIVIIAFILSFEALRDLAAAVGMSSPYLYPLMIDAGLVIYHVMALRSSLFGQRNWYAWFLIIVATLLSVVLNVFHAVPLPAAAINILAPAMAAVPPLVIFGAFHLVVLRIEDNARRLTALQSLSDLTQAVAGKQAALDKMLAGGQTEVDRLAAQRDRLVAEIEALKQARAETFAAKANGQRAAPEVMDKDSPAIWTAAADKMAARRELVGQLLRQGRDKQDIAAALGVSLRTIKRDIKALNGIDFVPAPGQEQGDMTLPPLSHHSEQEESEDGTVTTF